MNSKKVVCAKCSTSFPTISKLKTHLKKIDLVCKYCSKKFECSGQHKKHIKKHHNNNIPCEFCSKTFHKKFTLRRHESNCRAKFEFDDDEELAAEKSQRSILCEQCHVFYSKKFESSHVRSMRHIEKCLQNIDDRCSVYQTALKENLAIYKIINTPTTIHGEDMPTDEQMSLDLNAREFLESLRPCVEKCMEMEQTKKIIYKFRINLHGLYTQIIESNFLTAEENCKHFYSEFVIISKSSSFQEVYETACANVILKSEEFTEMKSGWTLIKFMFLTLEFAKCDFFKASSFLPTPKFVENKRSCINVKNKKDSKCFLYSVLACTLYNEMDLKLGRDDPRSYKPYFHLLNLKDISFPSSTEDIKRFERQNPDYSVNVFALEGKIICGPIYLTKKKKKRHANLLLIEKGNATHYIAIIKLSRLVNSQMGVKTAKYFCDQCLGSFKSYEELEFHGEIGCSEVFQQLPKDPFIKFNKYQAKQIHPCCFYGDLESILIETHQTEPTTPNKKSFEVHTHETAAVAYVINSIFNDKKLDSIRIHRGEDAMDVFIENLIKDVKYIYSTYLETSKHLKMEKLTSKIKKRLEKQKNCYLCLKEFKPDDVIAIDHQHFGDNRCDEGKIRGKTCATCNLQLKAPKFIPFFWHSGEL